MPIKSERQRRAMQAAAHGRSTLGIPKKVAQEFLKGGSMKHGHKSVAENVDAYDGAALGETPPRVSVPRGHPARDVLPRAVGVPAGVRQADGTDSPRVTVATLGPKVASQPSSSPKNKWPAGVTSYPDGV